MAKKTYRKLDMNQVAKSVVDYVTGNTPEKKDENAALKEAAAQLGRKGGLKGGPARANALSAKRRSEIAKKAARARWGKG